MIVELRLSGEPDDIAALLALLEVRGVEVALDPRRYANRRGFGVRMYAKVRREQPGSGVTVGPDALT